MVSFAHLCSYQKIDQASFGNIEVDDFFSKWDVYSNECDISKILKMILQATGIGELLFLQQSWKWKITIVETRFIFQGPFFPLP